MTRYKYSLSFDFVPLPLPLDHYRESSSANVTDRNRMLPLLEFQAGRSSVTLLSRYVTLPNVE